MCCERNYIVLFIAGKRSASYSSVPQLNKCLKFMNFREYILKHTTECKYLSGTLRFLVTISFTLQKIHKIISIIKTNSCRHSVNDSASKGLVISPFSEFRSCIPLPPPSPLSPPRVASDFKHLLSCNSCCNAICLYLKKV